MKFAILKWAFTFLLATGVSAHLNSQVTVIGHVSAEVVEALTATETAQLNFGKFSPETSGGAIQIDASGSRIATGTVALATGNQNAASFQITGAQDATFSVTLPQENVILTDAQTAKTMVVTNWKSWSSDGSETYRLTNGSKNVTVGATLLVSTRENNPTGRYSGTYTISFNYN